MPKDDLVGDLCHSAKLVGWQIVSSVESRE
jgi:hypothetical protein